jgi:nitrite reductase (NADH) small subunit
VSAVASEVELGPLAEIPIGEGRAYVVAGRQIAVYRLRDGSVRALDAVCPHRFGPLADGQLDNRVVVCPLHSYTYDLATGCEVAFGGAPVAVYPAEVTERGTVRVRIP